MFHVERKCRVFEHDAALQNDVILDLSRGATPDLDSAVRRAQLVTGLGICTSNDDAGEKNKEEQGCEDLHRVTFPGNANYAAERESYSRPHWQSNHSGETGRAAD